MSTNITVGAELVRAEPEERDGVAGFRVVYPDAFATWMPEPQFYKRFRPINRHEERLLDASRPELAVSAISDGVADFCEFAKDGRHEWDVGPPDGPADNVAVCLRCGRERAT